MKDERKILILLSVPRSGSTVIQDHLAENLQGAVTAPETWVIPFALAARSALSFSPIGLEAARRAEGQFGKDIFTRHIFVGIESFFLAIMDKVEGSFVFVEKTPRNLFYYQEISEYLPDAVRVVLVRHPIDVMLSSFEYFCNGHPNVAKVSVDIIKGMDVLANIVESESDTLIRYEDFVADGGRTLQEKMVSIGLSICKNNSLYERSVLIDSEMGDAKFKKTICLNSNNSYKHNSKKISLVTYLTVRAIARRPAYRYLMNTLYSDQLDAVLSRLRKNIRSIGFLDFLFLIGGGLSALFNLKILAFKQKNSSLWTYLR